MKLSYSWLRQYIDLNMDAEELSTILTDIGLEVEGIEMVESIKGGLEGIVVGEIVECISHPNADKLSLTKVNIGELELKQIVCGAPNVASGQKVLVATIGTTLYAQDGEPWKIKKGKIRGELSEGMICAEDELGLGDSHDGIVILPADIPVGTLAKDYYQIEADYVYDIGLTPNRSDATCHLGAAKDIAAYMRVHKSWTGTVNTPDTSKFSATGPLDLKINVANTEACPRYSGILLENITVGPSPDWMQVALTAVGVRPINNVVDITNYVLHELGQPLHAFDKEKISGGAIKVKCLPEGTIFHSLDEVERKLYAEDLIICDGNDTPMCIGGVFGGLESGVTDATKCIFLEAAHFDAGYIRRSSTRHLLRTDAAKVFEKGSDPNITILALQRAALLLQEHAGATIASEIVDIYPSPVQPIEVVMQYDKITKVIGERLEPSQIHTILQAMDMEIHAEDDASFTVKVPTNKADVTRDVDVIEEILRIYGYNTVPIPAQLRTHMTFQQHPTKRHIRNTIASYLVDNGFNEMMGLSLIESKYYPEANELVHINNTSNIHLDVMRPDPLLSGLRHVAHNLNHQQSDLKLFEMGRTYKQGEGYEEAEFLTLFLVGKTTRGSWNVTETMADFYDIKKWVRELLERIGVDSYQIKESEDGAFREALSYARGPIELVRFGSLHRKTLEKMAIDQQVFHAEFNMVQLIAAAQKKELRTQELSKYPSTERDLSLVINESVTFDELLKIARGVDKKYTQRIDLFDVYRNEEQLGKDKKAYAIKFLFQGKDKTLSDKEIEKVMTKLISDFKSKAGAILRQ